MPRQLRRNLAVLTATSPSWLRNRTVPRSWPCAAPIWPIMTCNLLPSGASLPGTSGSARADVPEVTTLARTIGAWWPQILAFPDTGITNASTEANNRLIKDAARIAFGFRNLDNKRRGVRQHGKRTMISQPLRG
jgi:hypothetical protein